MSKSTGPKQAPKTCMILAYPMLYSENTTFWMKLNLEYPNRTCLLYLYQYNCACKRSQWQSQKLIKNATILFFPLMEMKVKENTFLQQQVDLQVLALLLSLPSFVTYLFTAESVRMVAMGDLMFFKSHTLTVRSSLPETTLSPTVNTADVTVLQKTDTRTKGVKLLYREYILSLLPVCSNWSQFQEIHTVLDNPVQVQRGELIEN